MGNIETGSGFKDHFSGHAGSYAAHRPTYPTSLFAYLADAAPARKLAWDCGTGNGQAARALAEFFDSVIATDASAAQIAAAPPRPRVQFRQVPAERSGLETASADLITVAQALHWFDTAGFFVEADRVLKRRGLLAVWCYERCRVDASCDAIVEQAFAEVEDYWPPERMLVERHYADIVLPFAEEPAPGFDMVVEWCATDMLAYMRTWSASQRYMRRRHADPIAIVARDLGQAWGPGPRTVRWPLTLLLRRKP